MSKQELQAVYNKLSKAFTLVSDASAICYEAYKNTLLSESAAFRNVDAEIGQLAKLLERVRNQKVYPVMAKLRFHGAEPDGTANIGSIINEHGWLSPQKISDKASDVSAALDPFDISKEEASDDTDLGFLDPYEMVIKGFHLLDAKERLQVYTRLLQHKNEPAFEENMADVVMMGFLQMDEVEKAATIKLLDDLV